MDAKFYAEAYCVRSMSWKFDVVFVADDNLEILICV